MASPGISIARRIDSKTSRFSSLKLRNTLRERFNNRIKRNRETLLQQMRSSNEGNEHFHETLRFHLHDEMSEFEQSKPQSHETDNSSLVSKKDSFDNEEELELLMKQIENELVEEQLNWMLEEYRKAVEEQTFLDTPKLVYCPVCQNGFLSLSKQNVLNLISCTKCSMQLYNQLSLDQIETAIRQALNEHVTHCDNNPQFTVINKPNCSGLFIICGKCELVNLCLWHCSSIIKFLSIISISYLVFFFKP